MRKFQPRCSQFVNHCMLFARAFVFRAMVLGPGSLERLHPAGAAAMCPVLGNDQDGREEDAASALGSALLQVDRQLHNELVFLSFHNGLRNFLTASPVTPSNFGGYRVRKWGHRGI